MCKVSIIMTSYNKPEYVGRAIDGILNQTFEDFELLLMDDNSDEETQKVIKGYLQDERIRYFCSDIRSIPERVQKTRYAVLINEALSMAEGQYISYATDDDIYHSRRLEKMVNLLDDYPEIQIVYSSSRVIYFNKDDKIKRNVLREARSKTWIAPGQVDHCSIMHRVDILPVIYEKWGSYWDEDPQFYLNGDARFFWRLNHFWPFYPINEVLDYNYITTKSLHSQIDSRNKTPLIRSLPEQRNSMELVKSLKNMQKREMYLENYWLLFLDFIEVFGELKYNHVSLPLLANFYQFLDSNVKDKMMTFDFKKYLKNKSLNFNEIQTRFEQHMKCLEKPLSVKLSPGSVLLNFEFLRFSQYNYLQYFSPSQTVIFSRWEKNNYLGIPVHCIKNYKAEIQQAIDEIVKKAREIFTYVGAHPVFGNEYFYNTFIIGVNLVHKLPLQ